MVLEKLKNTNACWKLFTDDNISIRCMMVGGDK
jgi:hypothetical protein